MKKKLVAMLLTACMALGLCATTVAADEAEAATGDPIKVGIIAPLSGTTALQGEYLMNGYNFAVKHINEEGGINGRPLELVVSDSESLPEVGATEFEKLAQDDEIVAMMGAYSSGVSAVIAPLAIKYSIPLMVTHAVSDACMELGENKYVYRANCGTVESYVWYEKFFQWMAERGTPIKTIATVYENSDYGFSSNEMLQKLCDESDLGMEMVLSEPVASDSADLSGVINKLKAANPDYAYVALNGNDAVLFARQMKEYDCNVAYCGAGGGFMQVDYYEKVGDLSDYMMGISFWYYDIIEALGNPRAAELAAEYHDTYGYDMQEIVVSAWTATYVLADAMKRAESIEREAIADALKETDLEDDTATIFCPYNRVKFGDDQGRNNQNLYSAMPSAQMFSGEWKMIYPADLVQGENPLVWPVPTWEEREAQ